jgi:hypothetical protein
MLGSFIGRRLVQAWCTAYEFPLPAVEYRLPIGGCSQRL